MVLRQSMRPDEVLDYPTPRIRGYPFRWWEMEEVWRGDGVALSALALGLRGVCLGRESYARRAAFDRRSLIDAVSRHCRVAIGTPWLLRAKSPVSAARAACCSLISQTKVRATSRGHLYAAHVKTERSRCPVCVLRVLGVLVDPSRRPAVPFDEKRQP